MRPTWKLWRLWRNLQVCWWHLSHHTGRKRWFQAVRTEQCWGMVTSQQYDTQPFKDNRNCFYRQQAQMLLSTAVSIARNRADLDTKGPRHHNNKRLVDIRTRVQGRSQYEARRGMAIASSCFHRRQIFCTFVPRDCRYYNHKHSTQAIFNIAQHFYLHSTTACL